MKIINQILWTERATKQLVKLPASVQKDVYAGVDGLKSFPKTGNVVSLKNHEHPYRLRVGAYRVFFSFDGVVRVITIEQVKKRDERTY